MSNPVRFHLDENVDPAVAEGLIRRGVDATTTLQAGLLHASDDKQIEFALAENRILVTHDDDFLALAKDGVLHAGDAYCHPEARSIGQIIASLLLIRDCMSGDEMKNRVEFL
jgi:Domain of unknown function (DUF5615)